MLSETISQEDLDASFTSSQQLSLLRLKDELLHVGGSHMDTLLSNLSSYSRYEIDAALCKLDFIHFCNEFCFVKSTEITGWINFRLWNVQVELANRVIRSSVPYRLVVPKSRQVGITWLLGGAIPLWLAFYRPSTEILIYSLRERDATRLLSSNRLGGIISRIPPEVYPACTVADTRSGSNRRQLLFKHTTPNGYEESYLYSLNPREGDGYSAQYAFIDEADFFDDLTETLRIVEPATEYGKLIIGSRTNKENGESRFKELCRQAAYNKENTKYDYFFVPWTVPPGRTQEWYDTELKTWDVDYMQSNYPATLEEALAPAQLNKRIPTNQLEKCLGNAEKIDTTFSGRITTPALTVYRKPEPYTKYYIGVDTAQGLEHGDNSAIVVVDNYGEDVANIVGKISPAYQGALIRDISAVYNNAKVLIENNNHGQATILWMQENECRHLLLKDKDNKRLGWTTTKPSKEFLYVTLSELALDNEMIINDKAIYSEIQQIEKDTLSAPEGHYDDRSIAYALAQMARVRGKQMSPLRIFNLFWN